MADSQITRNHHRRMRRRHNLPRVPKIVVEVTQEMIDDAVARDSRGCPVAEAIQAAHPELTNVLVDLQSIRATDKARNLRFNWFTPRIAQWFITHFDAGEEVEPIIVKTTTLVSITRHGGFPDLNMTPEERRMRRTSREREYRKIKKEIYAPNMDEPFAPPREQAERVNAAIDDPEAPLGPVIGLMPGNGNKKSAAVMVGGTPPRHHGRSNVIRTRKFGLKELIR